MKKKNPIRVMLVDDHPAFRKGLAALVESEADLTVVAETGDGRQAVELFRQARPDVVLMDLRLPGMGGVEAILAIRKEFAQARVIVLTTFDTDEDIYRAIQSGAKSFLLKDTPEDDLAATIRAGMKAGRSCRRGWRAAWPCACNGRSCHSGKWKSSNCLSKDGATRKSPRRCLFPRTRSKRT